MGAQGRESQADIRVVLGHPQLLLCQSLAAYLDGRAGIRVAGTCGGVGAVRELVDATRPDTVVLGWDLLCRQEMEFAPSGRGGAEGPSLVLLMASKDYEAVAQGLRMGASACVLEHGPLDDLTRALKSVVIGDMWISPPLLTALLAERSAGPAQIEARHHLHRLTGRETEVLKLLVAGRDRKMMAATLHVSSNTVRTHVQNIEQKLKVHSVVAAVSLALQAGFRPE